MKKTRLAEERNPAPTTSANTILIQDEMSCTVVESPTDDDGNGTQDTTDIYSLHSRTSVKNHPRLIP